MDLRYAYLALRIDEESRKLTTFITPSGSYRWLALPTGAANSPAYFTDACNRILHYAPEMMMREISSMNLKMWLNKNVTFLSMFVTTLMIFWQQAP